MGTSGLPDICTRGPRAEGVYISQTTSTHGTNHYVPLCTNCVWVSAKQLKPMQYKNGFIVFIVAPIEFDYGFEIERLYCVLAHYECATWRSWLVLPNSLLFNISTVKYRNR